MSHVALKLTTTQAKFEMVTAAFEFLVNDWEEKRRLFVSQNHALLNASDYADFMWQEIFNDPNYVAVLEMLLAARGDPKLQESLSSLIEQLSVTRLQIWRSIFGTDHSDEKTETLMRMTICLFRGMSMQDLLEKDAKNYKPLMLRYWKQMLMSNL